MEVEAKFTVSDRAIAERLVRIERLAGFVLSPAQLKRLHDHYLDTADGAFLSSGFACRVRLDGGGRLLTLKSLTPAQGVMHMRQELEVHLPPEAGLDAAAWPDCEATALARQLSRGQPLEPLFELWQERQLRLAADAADRPALVALSIDLTRFSAAVPQEQWGVEAELLPAGDHAILQAIADELQQVWGLSPEPISKFERGLALVRPELLPLISPR